MSDNQAYNDAKAKEDEWRDTFFTAPVYPEPEDKTVNSVEAPMKKKKARNSVSFASKRRKNQIDIGI
jgi:hypothetical protein